MSNRSRGFIQIAFSTVVLGAVVIWFSLFQLSSQVRFQRVNQVYVLVISESNYYLVMHQEEMPSLSLKQSAEGGKEKNGKMKSVSGFTLSMLVVG